MPVVVSAIWTVRQTHSYSKIAQIAPGSAGKVDELQVAREINVPHHWE